MKRRTHWNYRTFQNLTAIASILFIRMCVNVSVLRNARCSCFRRRWDANWWWTADDESSSSPITDKCMHMSQQHIVLWARMAVEYIFNDRNVMSILCVHCTWFTLMVNYNFSTRHRQMIIVRWHWNHCRRSDNGNTIQVHFELGMSVAASNLTQSSSHGINLTSTTFHIHSRSRYIAVN